MMKPNKKSTTGASHDLYLSIGNLPTDDGVSRIIVTKPRDVQVHNTYAIIKEEVTTHFEKGRHDDVSVQFAIMYILMKIVLKFGNDEAKQQLEKYYRNIPPQSLPIKRPSNPLTGLMQDEIAKKDEEIAKLEKQLAKKDDQLSKQEEELANVGEHSDSMKLKLHEIELLKAQVEELTRGFENRPTSHDQAIQTEEETSMDVIATGMLLSCTYCID